MSYLDVSPVIHALRTSPGEFELSRGCLHHIRSRHSFAFDERDHVRIDAECNCALLAIRPEQQLELAASYREWKADYWRPLEINREFAGHFSPRPRLLRAMIRLTGGLHRWLLSRGRQDRGAAAMSPQTS